MGIVSKFFHIFKHREEVNEETVTEKIINNDQKTSRVIEESANNPVMVRADDFADSSIVPEEYKVADDDDDEEEFVPEEVADVGITVDEGDDMSPIIMDVPEGEPIDISFDDSDDSEMIEPSDVVEETESIIEEVVEETESIIEEVVEEEEIEIL